MSLPLIAARALNTLLMIDQRKAEAILLGFGCRLVDGGIVIENAIGAVDHAAFNAGRPSMGRLGDRLGRAYDAAGAATFDMVGNVAVIPIEGTLVHKGAFLGKSSGETSYQGLQTQVSRAMRADAVKGVVFEIDSYGGEMAGAFDTADMIAQLSAAKPTMAILTDNALSAGYLMASAARQIVMPEFGRAGSIGVITMHADYSRKLENEGIKVTILSAGKHKADGNPFQPLPEPLANRIRGEVEEARGRFAEHVGRFRGGRFTAEQAMATEAQDYRSGDALRLGLVDAVAKPADAFDAFVSAINRKG
jgi:signal peptide peptidase SppA